MNDYHALVAIIWATPVLCIGGGVIWWFTKKANGSFDNNAIIECTKARIKAVEIEHRANKRLESK